MSGSTQFTLLVAIVAVTVCFVPPLARRGLFWRGGAAVAAAIVLTWMGSVLVDDPVSGLQPVGVAVAAVIVCLALVIWRDGGRSRQHTDTGSTGDPRPVVPEHWQSRLTATAVAGSGTTPAAPPAASFPIGTGADNVADAAPEQDAPVATSPTTSAEAVRDYQETVPLARPPDQSAQQVTTSTRFAGRYQLIEPLGRGAMGVVYLSRDLNMDREVAIKTLSLESGTDTGAEPRDRFIREARAPSRLRHPGIVTVFDAGEENGIGYIVMERVRGEDLSRHCDPATLLPLDTVLHIVIRAAEALDHAHSQGVIHRDIKPANILYDARRGEVRITDFGIARISDVTKTRTGIVMGSPSYMPPEQIGGQQVDGRADVYALGVVLFQLITGQLPFRADSLAQLLHVIVHDPPADILNFDGRLGGAGACLSRILATALAKRPEHRFRSCAEFAKELRRCAQSVAKGGAGA